MFIGSFLLNKKEIQAPIHAIPSLADVCPSVYMFAVLKEPAEPEKHTFSMALSYQLSYRSAQSLD